MSVIIDIKEFELQIDEIELLTHTNTQGVILFERNIKSRDQIIQLVQNIKSYNPQLMIMIDQEGGHIQRIKRNGFRALPSPRVIGEFYDLNAHSGLEAAFNYGQIMAKELLEVGIDISLAPVLDLHDDKSKIIGFYDRAFHTDPRIVAKLAEQYINGMHSAGMPSVGKHFPGHGCLVQDSHVSQPIDDRSMETLQANDLLPFTMLIKSKVLNGIMPAHITFPKIDNNPAGFSKVWLQNTLREQYQYDGLIISDCLGMKGADIGDLLSRGNAALEAGCNLVIASHQPQSVLKAFLDQLPEQHLERNRHYIKQFRSAIKHPVVEMNKKSNDQESSAELESSSLNPTQSI